MTIDASNLPGDTPSFALLGTGALGGLYGGLLANAGAEIHFLARSDAAHLKTHGLKVESPLGDFQIPIQVYDRPQAMPTVDVVIVAWKTTSNSQLAEALQAVCGPDTYVLVLQNGLISEQAAAEIVGADRVLGGCCFLCSNKIGPGHIRHLDYGAILFGEYASELSGPVTPRMQLLEQLFRGAKIDMTGVEDLRLARWKKLVWNIPYNGLSVVLNASTDQIMNDTHTSQLAEDLMREVAQAASANDIQIEDDHIERMLQATREMVPYDSSMYLDYKHQRPMEVEAIFGEALRAAQQAGCQPRKIEMLYQQLQYLDRVNRA